MGAPKTKVRYSVEEYLKMERAVLERHEYLDGEIRAMAGESINHGTITTNIAVALSIRLKGKNCRPFFKDLKVRSGPEPDPKPPRPPKDFFFYPDVVVVCGDLQVHDLYRDVLLTANVIVEVLSPSTERFDRGEKFARYRTYLPMLSEYVLVSQDKPLIEQYRRQGKDEWLFSSVMGLENSWQISSLDCIVPLSEIYEQIDFEEDAGHLEEWATDLTDETDQN